MKIFITEQILSGNLGDGWVDDVKAAHALAEFFRPHYEALAIEHFPGSEILVRFEIQDACGVSSGIAVEVEADDDPEGVLFLGASRLELELSDLSNKLFQDFCCIED